MRTALPSAFAALFLFTAPAAAVQPGALVAAPAVPAVVGPPAICHPIDIGGARSLPWGGGQAFAADASYDLDRVVDDTLAILGESGDTLVHMETIRRAAIYLTGMEGVGAARSEEWRLQEVSRLVAALQGQALAVQARADASAADGLRLFDYGYLLTAIAQAGRTKLLGCGQAGDREVALREATLLRPDDGAAHLGYAIATWSHGEGAPPACYAHLDRALALAKDQADDGLLRRNLMSTMGRFLGADSYDDLVAKVDAQRQRA